MGARPHDGGFGKEREKHAGTSAGPNEKFGGVAAR
jgi:hypothetical protein